MEDALSSKPPPVFSLDQILYSKITDYFRNQKLTRQHRRSFYKDLHFLFKIISFNHNEPTIYLYQLGIIVFSNEIIGIQKKKLANLLQYTCQGLINSMMVGHKWTRLPIDSSELPFDMKKLPRWKTWRFFKIPVGDSISGLINETTSILAKSESDVLDIQQNSSTLIQLLLKCQQLNTFDQTI